MLGLVFLHFQRLPTWNFENRIFFSFKLYSSSSSQYAEEKFSYFILRSFLSFRFNSAISSFLWRDIFHIFPFLIFLSIFTSLLLSCSTSFILASFTSYLTFIILFFLGHTHYYSFPWFVGHFQQVMLFMPASYFSTSHFPFFISLCFTLACSALSFLSPFPCFM